jgi:hypothetical protein
MQKESTLHLVLCESSSSRSLTTNIPRSVASSPRR